MKQSALLAGIGEVDITPPIGLSLVGGMMRSTGVHDNLYGRALVLSDGSQRSAIVSLDLIGLDFSLSDEMRETVRAATGIAMTLLCCTHTHSAPFTIPWSILGWECFCREGASWRGDLIERVVEAVKSAASSLQIVSLHAGRASVRIGENRRFSLGTEMGLDKDHSGIVAPWVDVLRVDAASGKPIAVLFSHAAHPVAVHSASSLISADYAGYAAAEIRRQFGNDVTAMFVEGCCGNINVLGLSTGFAAAEEAGRALGVAAVEAAEQAKPLPSGRLRAVSGSISLPIQRLPEPSECEAILRAAEEHFGDMKRANTFSDKQMWYVEDEVLCLKDLLRKSREDGASTLRFDVNCVGVGDAWCLLGLTHEMLVQYQFWADRELTFQNKMVAAYVNGCESYVPVDAAFAQGGYEAASFPITGAALRYRHRLALKPGAEEMIKQEIRKVSNEVLEG